MGRNRRGMIMCRRLLIVAAFLLSAVSAFAQPFGQPTGCPASDSGAACLGSGGSRAGIALVVAGATFMRVAPDGTITFPNSAVVTLPSSSTYTDPTITVSSGSFKLGLPSQASGDILYADAATTYTRLAKPATTGMFLRYTGTLPGWSTLILPNAAVAGDLIVATATNTLGSVSDAATGQVLTSGGVGAVPAYSGSPSLTAVTAVTVTAGRLVTNTSTGTAVANVGANSCGTSVATVAGNETSGVITVGATAGTQCRITFTTAAGVARDCTVTDSTTTVATRATYVDTTHTDFLGAFVAGDSVTFICIAR